MKLLEKIKKHPAVESVIEDFGNFDTGRVDYRIILKAGWMYGEGGTHFIHVQTMGDCLNALKYIDPCGCWKCPKEE